MARKTTILLLIIGFILLFKAVLFADSRAGLEYDVKAAFLYNFAKYVEWPDDVFRTDTSAIVFAVVGDDPFGQTLEDNLTNRTVSGRRIEIRRYLDVSTIGTCHLLFIPARDEGDLKEVLGRLPKAGILTIGEDRGFIEKSGIIGFVVEDNKVRFDINLDAAERARLRISSKLLHLARAVMRPDEIGSK
jgi:hypothetical protein